jgi:hypothetical protein
MKRRDRSVPRDGIGPRAGPVLAVGPTNQRHHPVGRTLGDPVTRKVFCAHNGTNIKPKSRKKTRLHHHHARYQYPL